MICLSSDCKQTSRWTSLSQNHPEKLHRKQHFCRFYASLVLFLKNTEVAKKHKKRNFCNRSQCLEVPGGTENAIQTTSFLIYPPYQWKKRNMQRNQLLTSMTRRYQGSKRLKRCYFGPKQHFFRKIHLPVLLRCPANSFPTLTTRVFFIVCIHIYQCELRIDAPSHRTRQNTKLHYAF